MKTLEELKKQWEECRSKVQAPEVRENVKNIIRARVKKEKRIIMEYFWAAFIYHQVIYAFSTYLFIRYWGDLSVMLLSSAGALLYIPFTIVLMRKFKAMARRNGKEANMLTYVNHQYRLLTEFFQFKKGFDWIGLPASAFIFVWIIFRLYVPGSMKENLIGGLVSFGVVLTVFCTVTYFENKKRFRDPLDQLKSILNEFKAE